MIKIFLSVRNRLSITKKCIESLILHSELPHQIYVYDNATNHRLDEHFLFFHELYKKKYITQVTFTSETSTFNAFSKASSCNFFGKQHELDPKKDTYDFLLILDNDMVMIPGWDTKLKTAWDYVNTNKLNYIKVIGQLPGGIKTKVDKHRISKTMIGKTGTLGGSGLWSVRPNFFRDVGFLDLRQLVGQHKKHDQTYWRMLQQSSNGNGYIMGINEKLAIHCGSMAGSVCNRLSNRRGTKQKPVDINFEGAERRIDTYDFKTFYELVSKDEALERDW